MADSMRSIYSFGVAGLLTQSCDVYYNNDLRARNIGRISDLMSAQLRDSQIDELRIRALLVYGVFQVYALRGANNQHKEDVPPASIEIGIDAAHVAVAISFHWETKFAPNWDGLADRIDKGKGTDAFEKTLESISRHSSQVLVRYELKDRRIEIISLINRHDVELKDPTMVVAVDSEAAPLLEVGNYIELGDLNYSKLLKNPLNSESTSVRGSGSLEDEVVRIAGKRTDEDTHETRFVADKNRGDSPSDREIREEYEATINELKNTVQELRERLETAENAASERHFTNEEMSEDDTQIVVKDSEEKAEEKKDDWGFHFLKQVWPFAPKEGETKEKISSHSRHDDDSKPDSSESFDSTDELADERVMSDDLEPAEQTETAVATEAALRELQDIARNKKSKKLEATLHEIEEEVEPNKAKRWVENLSSDLLQEKAKLTELQRNLAKQMRQRELEFKTSELALKQELKRKDELIYQKQAAIENKSEQIAQLNLAVERASTNSNDKESQLVKVKLDRAQRLAQMKEEEAKALVTKVRDLENRLIIAQAKAQKGNDLQIAAKVQTLEKKVEEYKRINQRLMESLNSQKDKSSDKEVGDLRRKIDQLDRLNTESKRSLDKYIFKLRDLQESEKKLQSDLARAVEENRNLRKGAARGSGESGGQAA